MFWLAVQSGVADALPQLQDQDLGPHSEFLVHVIVIVGGHRESETDVTCRFFGGVGDSKSQYVYPFLGKAAIGDASYLDD